MATIDVIEDQPPKWMNQEFFTNILKKVEHEQNLQVIRFSIETISNI